MVEVTLKSVSVEFPIYDVKGRSLRRELLRIGRIGGKLDHKGRHVVVNALDDVSFSFQQGDRVGIVGLNGAGKTTLLRVVAGIYEPVTGALCVRGRLAPLFDMSLGMNPDATGYENIRLRGLFLGWTKDQIEEQADEISKFCDLGQYLYMPIRTYSSGMLVRLSFAISTAIQPEILLMDEAIGAGDAAFFHRAEERLQKFVSQASMLFLASHSDSNIRAMCNKAILLHHGSVAVIGEVDETLERYAELTRSGG